MKEWIRLNPPLAVCMIDEPKWKSKITYGAETQKAIQLIIDKKSYWFCKKFIQMSKDKKLFFTEVWALENKKEASYHFAFVVKQCPDLRTGKSIMESFRFNKEKTPFEKAEEIIKHSPPRHGAFCLCRDCEPDPEDEKAVEEHNVMNDIFAEF
jgi:hypothetical protein